MVIKRNKNITDRVYYGWIIVATLGVTEMVSWGVLFYAFTVMLKPMQAELMWNQNTFTGAFSLSLLLSGLAAVPIGRWLDEYGARLIMTAGSLVGVLLVVAWSQVTTIWAFYTVWLLIGLVAAAVFYESAFTVVANWFVHKRAQALTLLTFGGGLASVVFVPTAEWLVRLVGWRSTLLLLAGVLAIVTVPLHALVLRRRPADMGLLPDGEPVTPAAGSRSATTLSGSVTLQTAVRQVAFWWLGLGFSCSIFTSISITVYLIPYLLSHGYSSSFAAAALGLLGGSQIPGRLLFTPLGNKVSRLLLTAVLFAMQMVALLLLITWPTQTGVLLFAVLFGSGAGASSPARAALLAERYGAGHYGRINGVQALVMTLAKSAAPLSMGWLYLAANSYQPILWVLLLVSGIAVVALYMVTKS